MKNLVRGGAILSILVLFVAIVYAQTQTDAALVMANESPTNIENNISDNTVVNSDNNLSNKADSNNSNNIQKTVTAPQNNTQQTVAAPQQDDNKKLIKKTGSSRAVGASRGSFSATAYCLKGRTASGQFVRSGIIAADPRVLKLGSSVVINGGGYSGTYQVSDTGGKIKGNRIDIWMASCAEARRFGRRKVQIFSVL